MSVHSERRTLAGSFTADNCAEYARDYQAICPRIRHAVEHSELTVQFDYLFMTEREMDLDPVYEWFGKHGLRYYVGSPCAKTPNYITYTSLQRTRRQGHAGPKDIALFELLKPHLSRAVSLADQLGTLHSLERLGSAVMESLPQAVFALTSGGRVVHANGNAVELAASGDGLTVSGGYLRCARPDEQAELDRLIREASLPETPACSGWTRVSSRRGTAPYALFVAPLQTNDDELLSSSAHMLVVVHDPCARRSPDPQMLMTVYSLTDTEARLASAISGGHSLESAAASLGMQVATARSHLKAIFAKTGVNRQQDLVRLLAALSSMQF